MQRANILKEDAKRVVIVGAGFAGIEAARTLSASVPARMGKVKTTIISDRNYHLFTPLLYQVASGLADPYHVIQPVRGWACRYGIEFVEGGVEKVDLELRLVQTDRADIEFDYLILCTGSETNDFGIPGVGENALFLKKLKDGEAIRNKLLRCIESASVRTVTDDERRKLLTIVIVGGGSSGIELAGTLADYLGILGKYYAELDVKKSSSIILLEADKRLTSGLDERISGVCIRVLQRKGVDVRLETKVASIDRDGIRLQDGTMIHAETVVWTAGIKPGKVISNLSGSGVENRSGKLVVDGKLRLPSDPAVYVIGDCAYITGTDGKPVPATASAAVQEGKFAGLHIALTISGGGRGMDKVFEYKDKGVMMSLGRFKGVALFRGGILVSGFPGWIAWRFVHIALISTLRSKLGVLFDWTLAIFYRRIVSRTDYD